MNNTKGRVYVFNDVNTIIGHIRNKIENLTPLKLQKSLYFLWAFYSATYGNIDYNAASEFNLEDKYPRELFPADFEAWKYGPVINKVYGMSKDGEIDELKDSFVPHNSNDKEVIGFVDDLLDQIDSVDDFGLVARSHEDNAWKNAYKNGILHCKMDKEDIKKDYINYVEAQGEI